MSKVIGDEPCPTCRSNGNDKTGDHLMVFEDGGKHCNRCGHHEEPSKTDSNDEEQPALPVKETHSSSLGNILSLPVGGDIPSRKLLNKFTTLYGTRLEHNTNTGELSHIHSPMYLSGETGKTPKSYQTRTLPKEFKSVGESVKGKQLAPIGIHLSREQGKFLIVVEGFLDTVATKQMLTLDGKQWSVVGLWNSSIAEKQVRDNIGWFRGFETIVLALDQDEAGKSATDKISKLLGVGQVKVASYTENDPCDMLMEGKSKEFISSLSTATSPLASGVLDALDVLPDFLSLRGQPSTQFPVEWEKVNDMLDGFRKGEVVTYTGASGGGKSALMDELANHIILNEPNSKVGVLKMEHSNEVGLQSLFSTYLEVNLKTRRTEFTDEELTVKWNEYFSGKRAFILDHGFAGISKEEDAFFSKLLGLIVGAGCDNIIIDHITAVIADSSESGSNEAVDKLMYGLQAMAQQYQVTIHVVVHLRKTGSGGTSFEEGAVPSMDDIRGSSSIKQVSDSIIFFSRNTQHEDPVLRRVATLTVGKNRWLGATGKGDDIIYEPENNKYYPFNTEDHVEDINQGVMLATNTPVI